MLQSMGSESDMTVTEQKQMSLKIMSSQEISFPSLLSCEFMTYPLPNKRLISNQVRDKLNKMKSKGVFCYSFL